MAAQLEVERAVVLTFGGSRALPTDLYRGWITLDRSAEHEPRVQTLYSERMLAPRSLWSAVTFRLDDEKWVGLRGSWGRSDTEAAYSGGGAPEAFTRHVGWQRLEALAGLDLLSRERASLSLHAGPSWTRWRLDTEGTGRDVLASLLAPDSQLVAPIEWGDRSWRDFGGVVGLDLRLRLLSSLELGLGVEQRLIPIAAHELETAEKADLRRVTGRAASLAYEPHTALPTSFSVSFSWTPVRFGTRDPGVRVVERFGGGPPPAGAPGADVVPTPEDVALSETVADTAALIAELEADLAHDPEDPAVAGRLGILLVHTAPTHETDFTQRERAESLLDRALAADPANPRYLTALGVLLEKQAKWNDAERVLTRALEASLNSPEKADAALLADAFHGRARTRENRIREFDRLRSLGTSMPPMNTAECEDAGAFCLNWKRPATFFDWFRNRPDLSHLVDDVEAAMLSDFRSALRLAPGHPGANRGLLRQFARRGDWEGFARQARSYVRAAPQDPWAAVFLGAGMVWTGEAEAADSAFRRGIDVLDPEDRAVFEDIRPLLVTDAEGEWDLAEEALRERLRNLFWGNKDPLFLTESNERRAEHYARVALAELRFGEPQSGRRGWESARGQILVRYGRPGTVWQIPRDDVLVMSPDEQAAIREAMRLCMSDASVPCPDGRLTSPGARGAGTGRWIFWNYDPQEPSFIFQKSIGRSTVKHMVGSISALVAEEAKKSRPTTYAAPFRDAGRISHQIARFRGGEEGRHVLEIHGLASLSELGVQPGDSIVQGLFLFPRGSAEPLVRRREELRSAGGAMSYRLDVPAGHYNYSLEAATTGLDAAARGRGDVLVGSYGTGSVQLSDLLLASSVSAAEGPEPRTHRELVYEPLRCLALPDDGAFSVIFEIYGLERENGVAHYQVEIDSGETPPENLAVRLLRGLRDLVRGGEEESTLRWERVVEAPGDRVVEWFDLRLPETGAAERRLRVLVTDLVGQEDASAERVLLAENCGPAASGG